MFENPEQAFGGTKPMLDLIDAIYAAAQQPTLWNEVLDRIATVIEGGSITLFAEFADGTTPTVMAMAKTDPNAWRDYANYFASINPLMARGEGFFGPGETWFNHLMFEEAEFERTEFYSDFFRPYDMHHSVALRIALEGLPANLTCQRPKASGVFGAQADIVLQTLQPHLHRALTLYRQMETMQTRTLGLETALDAHGHAVIGLDTSGRVIVSNRPAIAMFEAGTGLRIVRGRLCCTIHEESRVLQELLTAVLTGGIGGAMLVHRAGKSALRVTVRPFRGSLPGRAETLAALLFLSDPSQLVSSRAEALRALYGLTPTECRVADMLLEGLEVREIAGRMRITLETTRFHVKRVLAKSGARRQSEFIRLMLALPGTLFR